MPYEVVARCPREHVTVHGSKRHILTVGYGVSIWVVCYYLQFNSLRFVVNSFTFDFIYYRRSIYVVDRNIDTFRYRIDAVADLNRHCVFSSIVVAWGSRNFPSCSGYFSYIGPVWQVLRSNVYVVSVLIIDLYRYGCHRFPFVYRNRFRSNFYNRLSVDVVNRYRNARAVQNVAVLVLQVECERHAIAGLGMLHEVLTRSPDESSG